MSKEATTAQSRHPMAWLTSRWLDDLFIFDTSTSNWNKVNITGYKPSARACHSLNRIKKKLYMFGGFNGVCSCKV